MTGLRLRKLNRIHAELVNTGVRIPSMCFSGHRRFPMGSMDEKNKGKSNGINAEGNNFLLIRWE